jgi:PBP1b-binding outer membrane lipoprotein LpoB
MSFLLSSPMPRLAAALATAALLAGCSHPITMITETAPPRSVAHLIQKKVAYA